jgi:hypothetical protein
MNFVTQKIAAYIPGEFNHAVVRTSNKAKLSPSDDPEIFTVSFQY